MLVQPLKYPGGKYYMVKHIVDLMPKHTHRVILFAGGMSEFWNLPHEGYSEVVNDTDNLLTNFYSVLKDKEQFKEFYRMVEVTPFSQVEWDNAYYYQACGYTDRDMTDVEKAYHYFVFMRQSMAGLGKCFSPLTKTRTRRNMNAEVSAWLNVIEGLPEVHKRLRRVVILCDDAIRVLEREKGESTFFYCDPPYLHETRNSKKLYNNEMTDVQHEHFLYTANMSDSKILISGYNNTLYNSLLRNWNKKEFVKSNSLAKTDTKRKMTECLWWNYEI